MGRLEKMKRLIIEEANKRLLGEEKVIKGGSPIVLGFLRINDLTVDTLSSKGGGTNIKISFMGKGLNEWEVSPKDDNWKKPINFDMSYVVDGSGNVENAKFDQSCGISIINMVINITLKIYEEGGKEYIKLEDLSVEWHPYTNRWNYKFKEEGIDCLTMLEGWIRENLQLDTPKELKTSPDGKDKFYEPGGVIDSRLL